MNAYMALNCCSQNIGARINSSSLGIINGLGKVMNERCLFVTEVIFGELYYVCKRGCRAFCNICNSHHPVTALSFQCYILVVPSLLYSSPARFSLHTCPGLTSPALPCYQCFPQPISCLPVLLSSHVFPCQFRKSCCLVHTLLNPLFSSVLFCLHSSVLNKNKLFSSCACCLLRVGPQTLFTVTAILYVDNFDVTLTL